MITRYWWILTVTAAASVCVLVSCSRRAEQRADAASHAQPISAHVSAELLRAANHGRSVFRPDGKFNFPANVTTVWVDVGAHHIETTRERFDSDPTLGLIAVEPLAECWPTWPDSPRLIGLPVAIFVNRGTMDFHVNATDATSSLLASAKGTSVDRLLKTVEIRKVPVIRLEDVLAAIPQGLDIDYLKTDVQGVDLQVVKSAGEELRRVRRVRVEVINGHFYEDPAGRGKAAEVEMAYYMSEMGFRFLDNHDIMPGRVWLDKDFVNAARVK